MEKVPGGAGGRELFLSVQMCMCECGNISPMHGQKQAGSSLAASHQKEEKNVPNLFSARELLVRELETFLLFRAMK